MQPPSSHCIYSPGAYHRLLYFSKSKLASSTTCPYNTVLPKYLLPIILQSNGFYTLLSTSTHCSLTSHLPTTIYYTTVVPPLSVHTTINKNTYYHISFLKHHTSHSLRIHSITTYILYHYLVSSTLYPIPSTTMRLQTAKLNRSQVTIF